MRYVKNIKFIIIPITFIVIIFFLPHIIIINKIVCETPLGQCNQKLTELLLPAENLNLRDSRIYIDNALNHSTFAQKFIIHFNLPSTLKISLIERNPKYVIQSGVDKIAEVSKEGMILDYADSVVLPHLNTNLNLPPIGSPVEDKLIFALKIEGALANIYPVIKAYSNEDYLDIDLEGGISVLFPLEGDRDMLLGSFVLIYNELTKRVSGTKIDTSSYRVIDLRFTKPILKKNI